MRVIPALAAMVSALFHRAPKKRVVVIDTPLSDALSAKPPRLKVRAHLNSYTRVLARAVMRDPAVSADPALRRKWRNERKRARRAAR